VLVIPRSTPDQVHRFQSSILGILQDETRLIIQAEKLKARQYVAPNGTVLSDSSGSEFWFYCIDPATDRILSNTHQRINSSLLSTDSLNHIAGLLATKLRFDVSEIRPPLVEMLPPGRTSTPGGSISSAGSGLQTIKNWEGFPVALIAVGILVFMLAFGGTIYVCVSWKRYEMENLNFSFQIFR
jgi:protocadherin-15